MSFSIAAATDVGPLPTTNRTLWFPTPPKTPITNALSNRRTVSLAELRPDRDAITTTMIFAESHHSDSADRELDKGSPNMGIYKSVTTMVTESGVSPENRYKGRPGL